MTPPINAATILENTGVIAARFAAERRQRQHRRELVQADFDALRDAGFLLTGVPVEEGGIWQDVGRSTRPICEILRVLARGDPSVALVCSMHPTVLAFMLASPTAPAEYQVAWDTQRHQMFRAARDGAWFGTITSEPGSGGDLALTKTVAVRSPTDDGRYLISGQKHFGSGSGIAAFMVTTAVPEGETDPAGFLLDLRGVPWDGSAGIKLLAPWDGHGMTATQSHAFRFERFPATRIGWPGSVAETFAATRGALPCMYSAVFVGIIESALHDARSALAARHDDMRPFERTEWVRVQTEAWLIRQAYEGMLRAIEQDDSSALQALYGKTAIAELAETLMQRLCKVIGGSAFSRHSPFGFWYEDVRALGFLRPPWGLAYDALFALDWS